MTAQIIVLKKGQVQGRYRLDDGVTHIGRGEGVDLRLVGPGVSRRHASLRRGVAGFVIADEGSRNGLWVNDSFTRSCRLFHADRLRIGEFELQFIDSSDPSAEDTPDRSSFRAGTIAPAGDATLTLSAWQPSGQQGRDDHGLARRLSTHSEVGKATFDVDLADLRIEDDLAVDASVETVELRDPDSIL